jgi:CheY-like chemotaxis protein
MPDTGVILLAEDREDDVVMIRRAFRQAYVSNPLHVVSDGAEAISYMKGEGKYRNREEFPLPDLMLLDLKMPRVDGFEVLKWIREQPSLAALRVVVLTSSEDLRDVNRAYKLGANSFMVKPVDFEDVVHMSQFLTKYWLGMSKVPEIHRAPKAGDKQPGEIKSKDSRRDFPGKP